MFHLKITQFMKLLTIICFILATTTSINAVERNDTTSYRNIIHKKKYQSIRKNIEEAVVNRRDNKVYVVTYLEKLIWHHKVNKELASQSSFDAFSMLNLNKFFPFAGSFYDTIAVLTEKLNLKWIEENRVKAKTEIGWLQDMLENGSALKLERKKFWKEYLAICKKHLTKESYYETANAIYEFHDSVGISFEDSICVFADTYHNLEKIIRDNIYFSDSIILENAKTKFFKQYSNDTRNDLTWEEQLEYAINIGKQPEGVKCPIKLKGYKERGYIKNDKGKKKLIEKMFSKKSCIALKNGTGKTHYGIYNIEHILATLPEGERSTDRFAYIKKRLEEIIEPGMKLLQLEWEYDKQIFHTTAIVSSTTNKIIYDNVGTIAVSDIKEFNEWDIAPRLHMGTTMEYENTPAEIRVVQPKPFAKSFVEYNMLGLIKYSYAVYCGAHFNEDGILNDYQIFQRSYSDDFHDCKTDVRTIEGDKGTSPRYKFFYIMGCGRMPVSIEWNEEGGARISVAEYYDKGERTLKPQWW